MKKPKKCPHKFEGSKIIAMIAKPHIGKYVMAMIFQCATCEAKISITIVMLGPINVSK